MLIEKMQENLDILIVAAGVDLAELIDVTNQSLSNWASGKIKMKKYTAIALYMVFKELEKENQKVKMILEATKLNEIFERELGAKAP
jgi:DNA-binding XRE family transcriptional regulator